MKDITYLRSNSKRLKRLPIIIPDTKTKEQMDKILEKENEISQQIKTLNAEQIALTDGIWSI